MALTRPRRGRTTAEASGWTPTTAGFTTGCSRRSCKAIRNRRIMYTGRHPSTSHHQIAVVVDGSVIPPNPRLGRVAAFLAPRLSPVAITERAAVLAAPRLSLEAAIGQAVLAAPLNLAATGQVVVFYRLGRAVGDFTDDLFVAWRNRGRGRHQYRAAAAVAP